MYYNTKKTKARFSRLLRHPAWNGAGLFSKEKISKGGNESGKSEEKRISGEAYDINKQTIYTEDRDKKKSKSAILPELA